ncbi:MAG: hypothetical protein DPW16_15495 [Chloroflexi bacterium]|nr:hypothetical protein [Chloroflexota bacterium]
MARVALKHKYEVTKALEFAVKHTGKFKVQEFSAPVRCIEQMRLKGYILGPLHFAAEKQISFTAQYRVTE